MMARGRASGQTVGSRSRAGSKGEAAMPRGRTMFSEGDESLVFKASEVARLLDTTIQTVHKLIRSRELLALDLRVKGSPKATYRITRESFEAYLAQAKQRAA